MLRLLLPLLVASRALAALCGYRDIAGRQIAETLDQCFRDNVVDSRARMAIGFEFCFGTNFQVLNDTVAIPYNKKAKDTTRQLMNLAQSLCSDNDDALDQFVFSQSLGREQAFQGGRARDRSPQALRKCTQFFSKLQNAVNNDQFNTEYLLSQNEPLLEPMYPNPEDRRKLFAIVLNVVQPLVGCFAPMEALKAELAKKYLRQYLAALVNPEKPSFDDATYEVLVNPELYSVQSVDSNGLFRNKRSLFDVDFNVKLGAELPLEKTVKLQLGPSQRLNATERAAVAVLDARESPEEREKSLAKALEAGKVSRSQVLSMRPQQRLEARLMSPEAFRKEVAVPESHLHAGEHVMIDDFWNSNVALKKAKFAKEDYDRYLIKGFDIEKKLRQLFFI